MPEEREQLEQIKNLLEKNLNASQEILKISKRVNNYVLWGRIMSAIYLFLIIAPIILAYLYLQPLISSFGSFLGPVIDPSNQLNIGSATKKDGFSQQEMYNLINNNRELINKYLNQGAR